MNHVALARQAFDSLLLRQLVLEGVQVDGFEIFVADAEQYDELFVEIEYNNVLFCRLIYVGGECQILFFEPIVGRWHFDLNDCYDALKRAKSVLEDTHGLNLAGV